MKNHGTVMKNQGFAKVGKRSLRGRVSYHFASLLGAFWTNFPAFGPSSCLLAWTGLTGVADRVDMRSCRDFRGSAALALTAIFSNRYISRIPGAWDFMLGDVYLLGAGVPGIQLRPPSHLRISR